MPSVFFPPSEAAAFFRRQLGSEEKAERKVSYPMGRVDAEREMDG